MVNKSDCEKDTDSIVFVAQISHVQINRHITSRTMEHGHRVKLEQTH